MNHNLTGEKNKQTIFFVHGLGADDSQFEDQHRFFSDSYKVLSVSLPGHGVMQEADRQEHMDLTLEGMAKDLLALLDKLSIKRVHYVGNSMGGNIGYEILKSFPERLNSLVTFGTTAELKTPHLSLAIMRWIYRIMSSRMLAKLAAHSGVTEGAKEKIAEMMGYVSKAALQRILPAIGTFNYLETIRKSVIPMMIIKGEWDRDINRALDSTLLSCASRPHFSLVEMQNVGHFANLDNPGLFNYTLDGFLKSLSRIDLT